MTLGPLMLDLGGPELTSDEAELLGHPQVGGVILFSRNFVDRAQVTELNRCIRAARSPAVLIAVDQEGGRVQRFRDGFFELPPLRWLGHEFDVSAERGRVLAMHAARLMAIELIDTGVDFSFAPVLDIDRGLCEVIGDRAVHSDPECVAALGLAYMQGMRQAGMAAVAKHFPGHGGVVGDSHLVLPEDRRDFGALLDDMQPYASLIDDGLRGIMMAHILYPEIDGQIASLSRYWMQTVLRERLGFQGAVFSDDLSMAGASVGGSAAERALTALAAGADMILVCNDRPAVIEVLTAIESHSNIAARARLAAMRPNLERYRAAAYGSSRWQELAAELTAARATPTLQLDGES